MYYLRLDYKARIELDDAVSEVLYDFEWDTTLRDVLEDELDEYQRQFFFGTTIARNRSLKVWSYRPVLGPGAVIRCFCAASSFTGEHVCRHRVHPNALAADHHWSPRQLQNPVLYSRPTERSN